MACFLLRADGGILFCSEMSFDDWPEWQRDVSYHALVFSLEMRLDRTSPADMSPALVEG